LYFVLPSLSAAHGAQPNDSVEPRPNILWISLEDISPDFGCYGDTYAKTQLFDRFARDGVRFTRVFTHSPVCAPSRSGIITGMYPTSIGTHHMRCNAVLPPDVKCFTEYLRAAGYYCTNNVKTDYQFPPPRAAWDENSNRAHWRGRKAGQPFFAVFNFTNTHESQIRDRSPQTTSLVNRLNENQRHDPARAILPPYYPDTPAVRRDWANYHDNVTAVEQQVARILDQLKQDGLAENTIVWIWGDHGRGLPRGKRWIYDSGIHIPLLIQVPEKWRAHAAAGRAGGLQPGGVIDDMIAAIDFGPTVLSLARVDVPKHMHGRPFLGPQSQPARKHVFAARDRMDERYDLIRAVRDSRFKYIRNFMPHVPYAQHIGYMNLIPTMQEWRRLHDQKKLVGPPALFFQKTKPIEELYDTAADPHEVNNLAADARHAAKLSELRQELERWMIETGDLGLIPEPILDEAQQPGAKPPATQSKDWRPEIAGGQILERLLALKEHDRDPTVAADAYKKSLADGHPAIRYWSIVGLTVATGDNIPAADLKQSLTNLAQTDPSPVVRITAARALARWGEHAQAIPILVAGLDDPQPSVQLHAAHAIENLGEAARPLLPKLKQLATKSSEYVQRVASQTVLQLEPR
jgi:uncharacterized sulfatase